MKHFLPLALALILATGCDSAADDDSPRIVEVDTTVGQEDVDVLGSTYTVSFITVVVDNPESGYGVSIVEAGVTTRLEPGNDTYRVYFELDKCVSGEATVRISSEGGADIVDERAITLPPC